MGDSYSAAEDEQREKIYKAKLEEEKDLIGAISGTVKFKTSFIVDDIREIETLFSKIYETAALTGSHRRDIQKIIRIINCYVPERWKIKLETV